MLAAAVTPQAGVAVAAVTSSEVAPAASATTASIKGWARMYFPAPGNDVQVTVDAHGEFTAESPSSPPVRGGRFASNAPVIRGGYVLKDKGPLT